MKIEDLYRVKSLEFICLRKTQSSKKWLKYSLKKGQPSSGLLILEVNKSKITQNILVVLQEQFILYKKQVLTNAKRFIKPGKVD